MPVNMKNIIVASLRLLSLNITGSDIYDCSRICLNMSDKEVIDRTD